MHTVYYAYSILWRHAVVACGVVRDSRLSKRAKVAEILRVQRQGINSHIPRSETRSNTAREQWCWNGTTQGQRWELSGMGFSLQVVRSSDVDEQGFLKQQTCLLCVVCVCVLCCVCVCVSVWPVCCLRVLARPRRCCWLPSKERLLELLFKAGTKKSNKLKLF